MAAVITITGILSGCGSNENDLTGKYVKNDDNKACYEYFDFKDDKNFESKNASAVGGETSAGTYEVLENGEIKFSYDGMGSDTRKFDFNDDKSEFTYNYNGGNDIVCHYKREDNS